MVKILAINVEDLEGAGCDNGNYPEYKMTIDIDGKIDHIEGLTCRCRHGCSGTDALPEVGQEFEDACELVCFMRES